MIFMLKARKYVSKRNSNHEKKQVNRLIILNGKDGIILQEKN